MSHFIHYKGYDATIEFSDEDSIFFGKVEEIRSLISFEGSDVDSLKESLQESVDAYLEMCKEEGMTPEKPYKGSINIRIKPKVHQMISREAKKRQSSINSLINEALEHEYLG